MKWSQMTTEQQFATLYAMSVYGGGFASQLSEAWKRADSSNSAKLGEAFQDLVSKFGPGSDFYRSTGTV